MILNGIQTMMRRQIEQLLNTDGAANAVTATLRWRSFVTPPGYDPNDESSAVGTVTTDQSLEFRAFFHQIEMRASGFQRFMEVQTGDVMLDYLTDLELEGKKEARIEINGRFYVQKTASAALKEAWDTQQGTSGSLRTLLLTPAP